MATQRIRRAVIDDRAAPAPAKERQGIQSMEWGVRLLDVLAAARAPMTLRDLSAQAGMSPSRAHRYLVSLRKCGLVEQDSVSSRYDLGDMALRLGIAALNRRNVVKVATAATIELNRTLDVTTLLSIWGESGPTVVAWYDGSDLIICNVAVGSIFPLLRTATGRVFLAYLPRAATWAFVEEELGGIVSRIPMSRLRTMADVDSLVARIRRTRLGQTDEEFLPGLTAIAAPVFNSIGRIVAAIAMLGVRGTLAMAGRGSPAEELLATADAVSAKLGYLPDAIGGPLVERLEEGVGEEARPI